MYKSLIAGAAGLALALPMAPALASSDDDEFKTQGTCTAGSAWELKAEPKRDGVKVEFQVESNTAGQAWDYRITGPSGDLAAGTATTDSEGEFEVKAMTTGSVTDAFTASATTTDETCDSSVGGGVKDDDSDDDSDEYGDDRDDDSGKERSDHRDDDVDEGTCTATSAITLTTKQAGKKRVATLALKGSTKGQKWRYQIKRGNKVIGEGVARTKGKKAAFKVKAKAKGKGLLTADAYRVDGDEDCSTDDD